MTSWGEEVLMKGLGRMDALKNLFPPLSSLLKNYKYF